MNKKTFHLGTLKPHPKSLEIFGGPKLAPEYPAIFQPIKESGIHEPLVVNSDLEVVSGTLRWTCLCELYGPKHTVSAFVKIFGSKEAELRYVIEVNLQRRQWTPRRIAMAIKVYTTLTPEQGGTRAQRGRPKKGSAGGTFPGGRKTDEETPVY